MRRKKSVEKAAGQRLSRERTLEREKKRMSSRSRDRTAAVTSEITTWSPQGHHEATTAAASSYRVERTVQVTRSFRSEGMPPLPPPRTSSSRRAASVREARSLSRSGSPGMAATSTPAKKRPTPYQLWREQRLVSEMGRVSPVPPTVAAAPAFEEKEREDSKLKKKRSRSPSGLSNASSTTAEPRRKVVPTAEVAETVSVGSNGSEEKSAKGPLTYEVGKNFRIFFPLHCCLLIPPGVKVKSVYFTRWRDFMH